MASNKNGKHVLEGSDSESNLQPEKEQSSIKSNMELFDESIDKVSEKTERTSRKRKLSERPTERSFDPAKALKLTEQIITGTTLLYCRSGQTALRDSNNLLVGPQLNELLLQNFDKETTGRLVSYLVDDEKLGRWFYNVVDIIGINAEHREACKEAEIMSEIMFTFTNKNIYYLIGSSIEGTFAPGETHDYDVINYNEDYHVYEDKEIAPPCRHSFLIIKDFTTPAGYVKLVYDLLLHMNNPSTLVEEPFIRQCCKVDKYGRLVVHEIIRRPEESPLFSFTKNKPALKTKNYYGTSVDNNIACRCKTWPSFAQEWISRDRLFGWPTNKMVQQLSSLGFFVVKKGHPLSQEKDVEWRVSFSLQERELMFSLTDVQHKCYTVLKMFNEQIIKSHCITSYHWKTCLFYVIEQNSENIWKKEKLFVCIQICILQMLAWVKSELCPNYFIPQDNLFAEKLNKSQKLEKKIEALLKAGFNCLLNVTVGKIRNYYLTRESQEDFQLLQSNSEHDFKEALFHIWRGKITITLDRFNKRILDRYYFYANENVLLFIQELWRILQIINDTVTITEHTTAETQATLSSLLPHIYTCLASNIAAVAIKLTNFKTRDFLLFGSFTYFMKGHLSGKLKWISVLYALGLYEDSMWYINQLDEHNIKNAQSVCACRAVPNIVVQDRIITTTPSNVSTCVSFLSSELPITPDALKYELFKYFGISVTKEDRDHLSCQWHYRAVIDCNFYFFFLKYLIETRRFNTFEQIKHIIEDMALLVLTRKVMHGDVCCNLIAWLTAEYSPQTALIHLQNSFNLMNSFNLFHLIIDKERQQKQYLFNTAKLHALVVIYKMWFARIAPTVECCFECFYMNEQIFIRCSNCKRSIYCSTECQNRNWKIHQAVCNIVKTYHNM